jgi:hypothetical protein
MRGQPFSCWHRCASELRILAGHVGQLLSSGVAAANALGLTTQMPVQQTFLSCPKSRKRYRFGKQEVTLRQQE